MMDVSREVLQDTIIALECKVYEAQRNERIHRVADGEVVNLKIMLDVLRIELSNKK